MSIVAEVATVAVIGAGGLGRDIAQAIALAGYRTILEDILPSSLRKAKYEFRINLEQALGSGRITAQQERSAASRLEYAESIEEAARQADLVIETVPEELESKLEIFILLDKICRPGTILVTTSSETDVSHLAISTYRADRCVGMRFVARTQSPGQIEIVSGRETSDETLAAASSLASKIAGEMAAAGPSASFPSEET